MVRYLNVWGNWAYASGHYMCKACWKNKCKKCELKKGKTDEWGNECACVSCYPEKHPYLHLLAVRTLTASPTGQITPDVINPSPVAAVGDS